MITLHSTLRSILHYIFYSAKEEKQRRKDYFAERVRQVKETRARRLAREQAEKDKNDYNI